MCQSTENSSFSGFLWLASTAIATSLFDGLGTVVGGILGHGEELYRVIGLTGSWS